MWTSAEFDPGPPSQSCYITAGVRDDVTQSTNGSHYGATHLVLVDVLCDIM